MERGLGRGLAAILPGNAERERRQLVPRDRLVDRLLGRCLDRVDQLGAPAVSVAAVERAVGEPIVVLRRPSLADLGPGRAYGIFAALARAGSVGTVDGAGAEVRVDGAPCLVVGSSAAGVSAVVAISLPENLEVLDRLGVEIAAHVRAVVAVETSDGTEVAPRVSVEVRDGQATARATLAGAVAPHPGVSGVDGPELVATAVAAAADGGWSVIDVTAWAESGTHLAIVELARGPELAIGAAVATSANHAALLATARAAGVVGIHHRPSSSPWAAA